MSNDEKNKKIEALEKMFAPKDELKLSGEKKNVKKQQDFDVKEEKEIELKDDLILPEPEKKVKEEKKVEEPAPKLEEKVQQQSPTPKNFPLEKLKENLRPEIKEVIKKLEASVPKESVDKLINVMETNKNIIFDQKVTNVFNGLSAGEASLLSKKLAEWDIPKEASEVNASVIVAWLNKTKK